MSRLRIAIAGLGPKGLFALERLLAHAGEIGHGVALDIDLFEPHAIPAAGPVYDPGQPDYLRMNFAAEHVTLWSETGAVPADERRSFAAWRVTDLQERYPPRAHVGRYLVDGLARMRHHAPAGVHIELLRSEVRAVEQRAAGWHVTAEDGTARDYDEVLVAIGHHNGRAWPAGGWKHAAPLVPAVFPVERWLSRERVPPGSSVALRGFALTFLDAALALTEGRGGAFERGGHPYRLRYLPGAADAGAIVPYSRTGRPMLAKPDPRLAAGIGGLDTIEQAGRERILALPGDLSLRGDLLAILASTAGACLLAANGRRVAGEPRRRGSAAAVTWLQNACDGVSPPAELEPIDEVERSLAIGAGLRAPDVEWALGHMWRSLYPALVERLGSGLPDRDWPAFRRLAAQMERVSFGPPPVNAAKLVALVDAGRVDLDHVAGGQIATRGAVTSIRSAAGERTVDVVVNAVLAPPGVDPSGHDVLGRLVTSGHARIRAGRRGLDVGPDASVIGRDGRRVPGLAVIGRATEDSVIGNDTLSRTLHPHADRWAARVVRRAVAAAPVACVPAPAR
jgi:diaminopimelate decarboxylase